MIKILRTYGECDLDELNLLLNDGFSIMCATYFGCGVEYILEKKDAPKQRKSNKATKLKYGEYGHVLLSDEEYKKLFDLVGGESELKKWIDKCDTYCEEKKKKYNNYYLTISKWYKKDLEEKNKKGKSNMFDGVTF